jgi:hypothetical protein
LEGGTQKIPSALFAGKTSINLALVRPVIYLYDKNKEQI